MYGNVPSAFFQSEVQYHLYRYYVSLHVTVYDSITKTGQPETPTI